MIEEQHFQELLVLLRSGDNESAEVVVKRYTRRLIGLAASRLPVPIRSKEDPEDAVQSALATFFRRFQEGEFHPEDWDELSTLLTYLTVCKVDRRIRKHLAAKRDVRKEIPPTTNQNGATSGFQPATPDPTPAESAMAVETIQEIMSRLRPMQQQVLQMRIQGHTPKEIALAIGKKERTVFRALDVIKARVQKLLSAQGED